MQAELFELLKTVLKARGLTYGGLAQKLGLSEPTVKRIFAERDCKLSRMTEICAALDLTLDDLVTEANRVEVRPIPLGDQIETQLAEDRPAFHLFLLLMDQMTPSAIQAQYGLEETALFTLGLRLEKLGLAEVMPGNQIRLTVPGPIYFRRDGPLHQRLLRLNMDFLRSAYLKPDTDHSAFLTQTRRMSRRTARQILSRLRDVQLELSHLSRKDQLTLSEDELDSYKLGIAFSPVDFASLLDLAEDQNISVST